jgi:FkbM family methyltransferase
MIDWRGWLLGMRWRAVRTLAPRRTVHSRGLRFTLQCDNGMTHYRWRTYNAKEPETLDWIDRWVRPGDLIFDIGANTGVYTLYVALRHRDARVVAFEPEYSNLHLLRDNVVSNGVQDRVEIYPLALSNRVGLSRLHVQDLTPGAALHVESRDPVRITRTHRPVVWREGTCAFTLDAFCDEAGVQPQGIKLDVDGTEPEVLEGGARTLKAALLRSVMIEMPADAEGRRMCERLLVEAGLRRAWCDPSGGTPNEVWARDDA